MVHPAGIDMDSIKFTVPTFNATSNHNLCKIIDCFKLQVRLWNNHAARVILAKSHCRNQKKKY